MANEPSVQALAVHAGKMIGTIEATADTIERISEVIKEKGVKSMAARIYISEVLAYCATKLKDSAKEPTE